MGLGTVNAVDGWTLTCAASGYEGVLTNNLIGVVGPASRWTHDVATPLYDYASNSRFGNRALLLMGNDVTAKATFNVPAGRYRLAAAVARRAVWFSARANFTSGVEGKATLTLADSSVCSFGTVSGGAMTLHDEVFPTIVEVPSDQQVTLTVALNQSGNGAMLFDDIRLVSASADFGGNYLKNGGAEESVGGWQPSVSRLAYAGEDGMGPSVWGYQSYEGAYCLKVGGTSECYQDIEFETAGTYRFTTHVRSRANSATWGGENLIRFWYYDKSGDGTKKQIEDLKVLYSSGFVERSFVFEIARAGTYRFGFTAHAESDKRTSYMDGMSIRKVTGTVAEKPSIPASAVIEVAAGARMVLDYTGTLKVHKLTLGGQRVRGTVSAADYPEFLGGVGTIEVDPADGLMILVR